MTASATQVLNQFRGMLGITRGSSAHHKLVDEYNKAKPLPVGYKVSYLDDWCDVTVSVAGLRAGASDLIGRECGVQRHIDIFKKLGIWNEDGKSIPKAGDIITFNWDDSTQPNDGWADHIGIVESVANGVITTIEGNYGGMVQRRRIPIGWGYIRGFARPKYGSSTGSNTGGGNTTPAKKTDEQIAKEVINGKWGTGKDRTDALSKAGYNAGSIQAKVNEILKGSKDDNTHQTNPFAGISVDSNWDANLNRYLQQYYNLPIKDGVMSGQVKGSWNIGISGISYGKGGSDLVAAIQKDLGVKIDRNFGPGSITAAQKRAGTTADGQITKPSQLAFKIKSNLKTKGKPW